MKSPGKDEFLQKLRENSLTSLFGSVMRVLYENNSKIERKC